MRVPLSPAEISLNGPMVLNDTEWYSMVISGIQLALFVMDLTVPCVVGVCTMLRDGHVQLGNSQRRGSHRDQEQRKELLQKLRSRSCSYNSRYFDRLI